MAPPRATLLDHAFALRPLLWIPAIALFEAGRAEAGGAALPPWAALPPLLSLLGMLGAVHVANGWRDRAGDRLNRKGGAVASGAIGAPALLAIAATALALAALAALLSPATPAVRLSLLASLLLGLAYVAPPLEAKRRPVFDLAAQALGYGVCAFLLGAHASAEAGGGWAWIRVAVPYALGVAAVGVVTMLADREGDERAGQRTTAVALGERRSAALALALALLTAGAGLAEGRWAPALWGLLAAAWLGLGEPRRAWNRVAVGLQLAFLILLAPRTPMPVAAALALGAAAALYDRSRGGAGYPIRGAGVGSEMEPTAETPVSG
ncbi:MAG TPA: UbiA family prenyltransferase [Candidatus Eisenbacteria bacterium]|nr:UbiA family prenyltransferase [Candidatus Eisenbacteria bacterium]